MQEDKYLFQYCQKLVILNTSLNSVLLAKRQNEPDYDGVWSFLGGKLEVTDHDLMAGLKREKEEEIGKEVVLKILPNPTHNVTFTKNSGRKMILPHYGAIFESGEINLSNEYSEYEWVKLEDVEKLEPKIPNVPELTVWAKNLLDNKTTFYRI